VIERCPHNADIMASLLVITYWKYSFKTEVV